MFQAEDSLVEGSAFKVFDNQLLIERIDAQNEILEGARASQLTGGFLQEVLDVAVAPRREGYCILDVVASGVVLERAMREVHERIDVFGLDGSPHAISDGPIDFFKFDVAVSQGRSSLDSFWLLITVDVTITYMVMNNQ